MGVSLPPENNNSPLDIDLQLFLAVVTHETAIVLYFIFFNSSILGNVFLNKKIN